jgi:hypothetical protein
VIWQICELTLGALRKGKEVTMLVYAICRARSCVRGQMKTFAVRLTNQKYFKRIEYMMETPQLKAIICDSGDFFTPAGIFVHIIVWGSFWSENTF